MKTILITGGSGFIGSHLVDAFAGSYRVICLDLYPRSFEPLPENVVFIQGDLNNPDLVRRAIVDEGVETVIHAAWATIHETSLKDPAADVETNLVAMVRLLEACEEGDVRRFVLLSSGGQVYGLPQELPIRESHPTDPISPYGITKLGAEKYLQMHAHYTGLESVIFRPSVLFGPRQNPRRRQGAATVFIHRALTQQPVEIWGDGQISRDYFYIDDLVQALTAGVEAPEAAGKIFNLGGSRTVSLLELVAAIESALSVKMNVYFQGARAFDVPHLQLDWSRAKEVLGWAPQIDLHAGIRRTAEWMQAWYGE